MKLSISFQVKNGDTMRLPVAKDIENFDLDTKRDATFILDAIRFAMKDAQNIINPPTVEKEQK